MLKKERQKKQFDRAWKSMVFYLREYYATRDPEALHSFRVKAKKAYALLLFLQGRSKRRALDKDFLPVRQIFKAAGVIRAIQVHLDLLTKAGNANTAFIRQQKRALSAATKKFCANPAANLSAVKTSCRELSKHFHNIKKKRLLRLFRKRLDQLNDSFSQPAGLVQRLHKNRKWIKRLLFFHECLPASAMKILRINVAYLEKLGEKIGQWHDVTTMIDLLHRARSRDQRALDRFGAQERILKNAVRRLAAGFAQKSVLSSAMS